MTREPRRVEQRADIRTEASFVGWSCTALALLGWFLLARAVFGADCGDGCRTPPAGGGWAVLCLAVAVAATAGAAASYAVSAVGRLLAAEPERRD
jgi:hypothetical protein